MSSELLAALFGATVAFAGTYLLQQGRFRKAELDVLQQRLGLARALRADLHVARLACEMSLQNKLIPLGTRFPVDLWSSEGHRLIGVIHGPAEAALVDAFGRMTLVNGILAALPLSTGLALEEEANPTEKRPDLTKSLKGMVEKIDLAVDFLDALQMAYEKKERYLRHPIRARIEAVR